MVDTANRNWSFGFN